MPEYRDPWVTNLASLLASPTPHEDPYGLSTVGRPPSAWSGARLDPDKIKDDDPNRWLLNILLRPEMPPGVMDDGSRTRSNIANMLMEVRSRIPDNPNTGWSAVNMLRGGLENAANTFDRAGGYLDPAGMTAFDVPMMGPGYLAVAAPRNALGAFGGRMGHASISSEAARLQREIAEILQRGEFDRYGLRVTAEPLQIGQRPPPSRVWVDGEPTNELLGGVSVHGLRQESEILRALDAAGYRTPMRRPNGYYPGSHVSLLGGSRWSHGYDPHELILGDPQVLRTWTKSFGPETEP